MQLLLSACLLAGLQLATASIVLDLDAAAFHKTIDVNEASLIMFYAPWCPHCQDAKPKFASAAKELGKEAGKVLGMVNCDEKKNQELCTKLKIEGYPTFKFYSKGKFIQDYEDEPSEKAILAFMKNPPKEGEKRPAAQPPAGQSEGEESEPDTPMQSVTYLTASNFASTLDSNEFVLIFYYAPWCPHCKDSKPKYEQAAKDLAAKPVKGRVIAAMNCDQKENQKVCEDEKVEGYPTIRLMKKRELWAEFEEEIEPKPLLAIITNPPKEKVPPTPVEEEKKTGEGSEKQAEEKPDDKMQNVKYLEGAQAVEELKAVPHALIMFYAPWCPHCQDAKPAFNNAAAKVAQESGKVLAAVNCDVKANEKVCEENKIEGFPTFLYFANGVKKQDYPESPITEKGVVEYMSKLKVAKEEL